MARPKNRYARAQARARYRKPKRRNSSLGWYAAIAVIVVVGVAGIVVSRSDRTASAAPVVGDHWHASLDVNVCGQWLSPTPAFESRSGEATRAGLHSHADGLMHIHPFASDESGAKATVGRFLDYGGWDLSEDSLALWEGEEGGPQRNGDTCPDGKPGELRWYVNGEEKSGNPAAYNPNDGERVVITFDPADQQPNLDEAPNQQQLGNPSDL